MSLINVGATGANCSEKDTVSERDNMKFGKEDLYRQGISGPVTLFA